MNFFKKNKFILIALGALIGTFLIPQFVHADAFGVMDIFSMQLDALDFLDNTVRKYLVFITAILSESMIFLSLAGSLVDWAMDLDVGLMQNPMVVGGWEFIVGLANLIIIISFVWTGLSMILKGDSAQGQRRLFTLIGLALIVNFSLFMMGGLVDIAGYIQEAILNAVSNGSGSLASGASLTLINVSMAYFMQMIGLVVAEILLSLIPIGNVASIVAGGIAFVTLSVSGWLPILILTITLNFLVGMMFLLLAGMFLMRICFLWILAILAPLAVVSYQSEIPIIDKFFGQWLKLLSEWLFIGIPLTFLLGLGFKLFSVPLAGAEGAFSNIKLMSSSIPETFSNYIFLFLYMIVVFLMSKSFMPTMGKQIISTVTGGAKTAAKFMAPRMQKGLNSWQVRTENKMADRKSMSKEAFQEKYSEGGEYRDVGLNSALLKPVAGFRKYVMREAPGTAQKMVNEDLKKQSEAMGHLSAEQLESLVAPPLVNKHGLKINRPGSYSDEQMAGILLGMKSSELHKFFDKGVDDKMMQKIYSATISGNKDLKEKMERVLIKGDGNDDSRLKKVGGKSLEEVIKGATGEKCMDINTKAMDSLNVIDAIAKNWTGNEVGTYSKKSNEFIQKINENFNKINEVSAASNLPLNRYINNKATIYGQVEKKPVKTGENQVGDAGNSYAQYQNKISGYSEGDHNPSGSFKDNDGASGLGKETDDPSGKF